MMMKLLLLLLNVVMMMNASSVVVFKVSSTLGSHMVLQRDSDNVVLYGFAQAGSVVNTTIDGKSRFSTVTDVETGIWRQKLPRMEAGGPYSIVFENEGSENITIDDVMFGDVYLCGGQSNMQFSLGGNENATTFANDANNYPNMRLFTVGQGTMSPGVPLDDLKTVEQVWTRASSTTVTDGSAFNYFSAVCFFFGKTVSDSLNRTVPIGLISNNWGGTKVEQWLEPASTLVCGHNSTGELYNSMIAPYVVGPTALTGFIWYQGESDYAEPNNMNYTCTQTVLIENWRTKFQIPEAFFGIVQLSTWLVPDPILLAELRDEQLISLSHLSNVAYATNADRGAGSNIHPPFKEYPGTRLGNAARSIVYKDSRVSDWKSPSYESSKIVSSTDVVVTLKDVPKTLEIFDVAPNSLDASYEACLELNKATPRTCAYAEIKYDNGVSVNASVISVSGKTMTLRASNIPLNATRAVSTSYGWGAIPMLNVYSTDVTDGNPFGQLPVLPWGDEAIGGG